MKLTRIVKRKVTGLLVAAFLIEGIVIPGSYQAKATVSPQLVSVDDEAGTVSGEAASTGDAVEIDTSKVKLNRSSVYLMVGKKFSLSVSGLPDKDAVPVWSSANKKVAKVTGKGVVKGVKKGTVKITMMVLDVEKKCTFHILDKMSQKDFGKMRSYNFVTRCKTNHWVNGYAWDGLWKGCKKKPTYRGVKLGTAMSTVKKKYGDFTAKAVKSKKKDPFLYMKGVKKSKVKTYTDFKYGEHYRIRFYFDKNKKVATIIFACNISKIKKSNLSAYI